MKLIAARYLVDRIRQPRSRADDVLSVRTRLDLADDRGSASGEEIRLAHELARLRADFTEAVGPVTSCGGCAKGQSLPHGRWNGGHCCGGETKGVFTDDEIAALKLSGTTPAKLRTPAPSDHAGCAFRGPEGCSLDVADRPNLCVRFVCRELEAELVDNDTCDWPRAKKVARELGDTFTKFEKARAARRG